MSNQRFPYERSRWRSGERDTARQWHKALAQAAVARNLKENSRVPDTASDLTYRGKRLQVVFTVEDEGVFTMPWSGSITYERPAMAWPENVCSENPFDFFAGKNEAFVPTANKPDF
jgi:hypothetical protein